MGLKFEYHLHFDGKVSVLRNKLERIRKRIIDSVKSLNVSEVSFLKEEVLIGKNKKKLISYFGFKVFFESTDYRGLDIYLEKNKRNVWKYCIIDKPQQVVSSFDNFKEYIKCIDICVEEGLGFEIWDESKYYENRNEKESIKFLNEYGFLLSATSKLLSENSVIVKQAKKMSL
jgi:hypothetical protein